MKFNKPAAAALCAAIALGACTDPGRLTPNGSASNSQKGALLGGILGAGVGVLSAENKAKGLVLGGLAGAFGGGAIGNHMDKQEAELRGQLGDDGITVQNTGDSLIVSLPQDITFDTDSYSVRPALQVELRKVAESLVRYPNSSIQVVGHTDSSGSAEHNTSLSQSRASSVADVLQADGVAFDRLQTIGRGEDQPVASNLTEEGKALNRRVDIVVTPNQS